MQSCSLLCRMLLPLVSFCMMLSKRLASSDRRLSLYASGRATDTVMRLQQARLVQPYAVHCCCCNALHYVLACSTCNCRPKDHAEATAVHYASRDSHQLTVTIRCTPGLVQ